MHNFKKVTLGIFILPLLLIFQSVSYSQQITKPVTYHYKFAPQFGLLGEGIDWEKYIPGEDSPFAAHFKFLLSPPTFEGEMNAAVTLDLDQKDPTLSVQPRFVTDDGNTFVGKFESQGGVIITGDIVIDFSVLPFFNDTRKHRIPIFKNLENLSKIPGTGPIIEKFGKIAAKLDTLKDKGWDTTEHAHSLLLEEDESIRLEEVGIRNIFSLKATDSTQDSTEEEESALEFTRTDATIIAAHTTAATTTGGAGVVALDAVDDTLIKEIKEELGDAGLKVNLGILTPLTLSSSGVYLDGKFATRKGQPIVACGLDSDLGFYGLDRDSGLYTLSTNYVGNLKMEVDFVVSFDLFYNVSPLGITLWSGGIEVAEQRIGITDKEFTLNFEPTAPVKFEVDADSLMEAYREEATAAERFAQDFQHFTQWHLPEGTEMRLGSAVSAIAYSPDGCQIAVANWNGSTSIYRGNLHSIEKQKFYIGTNGGLDRLSFSPDGKTLAGGAGTTVWLWDVATRALKAIMSHDRPWAAFHRSYWITGLSFSPDGKTLASASSSSASWSEVGLWDVETGTLKGILGHGHGASFSPDGKILATRGKNGVHLWDVEKEEKIATLQPDVDEIHHVSFSRDSILASVGSDGGVHLWDVKLGEQRKIGRLIEKPPDTRNYDYYPYYRVSFSRDGKTLASSRSGRIVLWNIEANEIKKMIHTSEFAESLSFSPDGATLAGVVVNDWTAHVWQVHTGAEIAAIVSSNGSDYPLTSESISFSPNGKTLASSSGDGVHLWDVETGVLKYTLPTGNISGNSTSFSPDGVLATVEDGKVWLWHVETGQRKIPILPTDETSENYIRSVSFSRDGKWLAGAGVRYKDGGSDGAVWVWNITTQTGKKIETEERTTLFHDHTVRSVNFNPLDSNILASSDTYGSVRLWDVTTGKQTLLEHSGYGTGTEDQSDFRNVRFSPNGKILASGVKNGVLLWNAETQEEIATLRPNFHRTYYSVSFSPDSKTLASSGDSNTVQLWDIATRTEITRFRTADDQIYSVSFSPDNTKPVLASMGARCTVLLWDPTIISAGTEIAALEGHRWTAGSVSFNPLDGKTLASCDSDGVRLWDVETQTEIAKIDSDIGYTNDVSFSRDGKILAIARGGAIRLWDVEEEKEIAILTGQIGYVNRVSFSPLDRKTLASCGDGGTVQLWDVEEEKEIAALEGHTGPVYSVSFSPDGKTIASCGDDPFVRLWDVETRTEIATLRGHLSAYGDTSYEERLIRITSVSFSPDGKILASGGYDGTVRLWDVATETLKATLQHRSRDHRVSVSFSPDGKILASNDEDRVVLWDATTGAVKATLAHDYMTYSVDFSPDRTKPILASGGDDGIVRLWDVASIVGAAGSDFTVDVNSDGMVNIQDLVAVSAALGETGENDADVNGDGIVNIQDLVAVSAALGQVAAAPSAIRQQTPAYLTPADVQQWLIQAQQLDLTDPTTQRGILFLQYLLAVLTPQEMALLQNYPNPFNPETWIPYQLAKPADVALTIYDIQGHVVRDLDLGHQRAGIYQSRARAAYWDGRNTVGEQVASGVYFYTLKAGDFTATRKMLIRK